MIGRGAAALTAASATLALAACGATTGSVATGLHRTAPATPAAAPATTAVPAVTTAIPATQSPDVLVVGNTVASNGGDSVTLVRSDGSVLGRAMVPAAQQWSLSAGPQGAYWNAAGRLHRLDLQGHDTDMGALQPDQNGHIAVSPDGSAWIYATSTMTPNGVRTNRLWRGGIGVAAQMIAERVDDPMHPTPGMPVEWVYSLKSWTTAGVLTVREPAGGCGCAPFDMETVSGSSLLVDPYTGIGTPLGTDGSCPLSGGSSDATVVCFHAKQDNSAADEMRVIRPDRTAQRFSLTGTTVGGDARFDPTGDLLAYATVPGTFGCGDWPAHTTLRVIDLGSGQAHAIGPEGFQPAAWLAGGRIGGELGGNAGGIASVDTRTGLVHTLMAGTSLYVVGAVT